MQRALIAAASVPAAGPTLRRPSLCHDGSPVVYSHDVTAPAHQPGFRILTEPGGVACTVPQQIDFSLSLVDRLLVALNWSDAAADLNAIAAAVLPGDPRELGAWWGGVWIGACQNGARLELRLYFNLRHGHLVARWQRVAAALACFGDDRLESPLQALANRTMRHAIPVGLGVVVRDGGVPVLRIYCSAHRPETVALAAMVHEPAHDRSAAAALLVDRLGNGKSLPSQSVTLGYDFVRDTNGIVRPEIARIKIDVSCQWLAPPDRVALLDRATALAHDTGVDTAALEGFVRDLNTCFGGFSPEYVSYTLGDPFSGMTLYAKPAVKTNASA